MTNIFHFFNKNLLKSNVLRLIIMPAAINMVNIANIFVGENNPFF